MVATLIKYSQIYKKPPPDNYIDLVRNIPKNELIAVIATLNARLKPIQNVFFDESRTVQINGLRLIFLDEDNSILNSNCKDLIKTFIQFPHNYRLFNRVTCLYALQKIINSDYFNKEDIEYTVDDRENIFKFLLVINEQILGYDNSYNKDDHKTLGESFFEYFLFKELPHNQYFQISNTINAFYKSWILFKALINDSKYGEHLTKYLERIFGTSDLSSFYKVIIYTFMASYDKKLQSHYVNVENAEENLDTIKILDSLSNRVALNTKDENNLDFFEFLDLKKSPLYKDNLTNDTQNLTYIILDTTLFVEKFNSLFINDFWFDYLRPNKICNRTDWGNFIGSIFFEPLINVIFENILKKNKRIVYRHTDALKFRFNGKDEIEYADYYFRQKNTIILAEAKSNYLNSKDGYKKVNTIEDYSNLDLERFYKDFGLKQLVNKVIEQFDTFKKHTDDRRINAYKQLKIYPVIILNDSIFNFSFFSYVFKQKFTQILQSKNIEIENAERKIYPVTLILISDLQDIEQSLHNGNENLFNLIRYYHSVTHESMAPVLGEECMFQSFSDIVNKRIKSRYIADYVRSFKWIEN